MRLFRRKDSPNWQVEIARGKVKSLRTHDEVVAREIFREMQKEELRVKLHILDESDRITIASWSEMYRAQRGHLSDNTTRMDELSLRLLGDVIGQGRAVKAIDEKCLNKFKAVCLARKVKPGSINSYLRHIKAALNEAKHHEYIKKVPRFKFLKEPKRLPKYLEPEAINLILAYTAKADHEMWRIIQFALWTGLRRQEVLKLSWQDVTGDEIRVVGKGDKERVVDLMPDTIKAMGDQKNLGPVFHQFHKDTVSHRFNKYALACGVKATFHQLRHTSATYMLKNGVPLEMVQEILGHADQRTTKIYAHVISQIRKKEHRKLRFV